MGCEELSLSYGLVVLGDRNPEGLAVGRVVHLGDRLVVANALGLAGQNLHGHLAGYLAQLVVVNREGRDAAAGAEPALAGDDGDAGRDDDVGYGLGVVGGGVVGDLGGFAAASFMRGIAFVQIPTSLLAQIDSSVGGKVAVDLKAGKNLAGAFYQPKAVFIDTDLLATLSTRFLHDGLAEAIKYGCIKDAALFDKIAGYADDAALLADIDGVVATCCAIKARIVEQDEFDTGLRMLLNFGHTLGHAVEQHFGYSCFTHGEGVAIGMYQLTKRTEELGMTAKGSAERIKSVLEKYNLPLTAGVEKAQLLDTMARDKKKNGNSITLIILQQIGEGVLQKVDWQQVPRYLG